MALSFVAGHALSLGTSGKGASFARRSKPVWRGRMNVVKIAAHEAPKGLFVVAFGFLCVLVGIASAQFEFFPYPLVRDAWQGAQAARRMLMDPGDKAWADGTTTRRRFGQSGVIRY